MVLRESLGGVACKWVERFLIHGEGDRFGSPFRLLPWHREFLWRWYELDPAPVDGRVWWYDEALAGAERGAVKTEFFAALALLEFAGPEQFRRLTPIIDVAAASYDQAGQLFGQVQIMAGGANSSPVAAAPLCGLFDVFDREVLYRDGRPGRIARMAAEAGTAEGGKTTLFLADELHEWTGRRARVYTVMSAGLTKRRPPGRACGMSTAAAGRGASPALDSDPLLWRLYDRGRRTSTDPESRFLFDWREIPGSFRFDRSHPDELRAGLRTMRAADIAWSVEHRAREIETGRIPLHEAERYYANRFTEYGVESWLSDDPTAWAECCDPAAVPADGSDVVVGVDMALRGDTVGVVVAGRLPDGRVGWWSRVWERGAGADRIDHLDVVSTIAGALARRWRISAITYDPRFFEVPAALLADQGFRLVEFPQSLERLVPADAVLLDLVTGRKLAHVDDPVLAAHVVAAAWRDTDRGRYLSKAKSRGRMDLVRAGSMATFELLAGSGTVGPVDAAAQIF